MWLLPVIIFAIRTQKIDKNQTGLVNKKNTHMAISSRVNKCVWGIWGALQLFACNSDPRNL